VAADIVGARVPVGRTDRDVVGLHAGAHLAAGRRAEAAVIVWARRAVREVRVDAGTARRVAAGGEGAWVAVRRAGRHERDLIARSTAVAAGERALVAVGVGAGRAVRDVLERAVAERAGRAVEQERIAEVVDARCVGRAVLHAERNRRAGLREAHGVDSTRV